MTAINRRLISLLLSLLLVISGPVLAVSQIPAAETGKAMVDCGSMMTMDQDLNTDADPQNGSGCPEIPDMVCVGAGGMAQCSVTFAALVSTFQGIGSRLAQPALPGRISHYQSPYLASITPPPENHS